MASLTFGVFPVVIISGLSAAFVTHWFPRAMSMLGVVGGLVLLGVGPERLGILRWGWSNPIIRPGKGTIRPPRLFSSYATGIGLAMGFQVTLLSTLSLIAGNRDLDKALFTLLVYAVGFGEAFLVVGVFGQGIVRLFKHIKPQNLGLINQVAGRLTVALILIVNDGDVLKALATWKTGPSLTRFLK